MSTANVRSALGPRLRALRLASGIGLRELARRLDVSPSSISQIETGKMQPSVRTLYAFARQCGVSVDEVFVDHGFSTRSEQAAPETDSATTATGQGLAVQRASGRPSINLNAGITWERLMFWADEDVEFIEATYEPGSESAPTDGLVRHNGREFLLILSGTLRVTVGFDELLIGPGDAVTFPALTPHHLSNDGGETVCAIWVVRGRRSSGVREPVEVVRDRID